MDIHVITIARLVASYFVLAEKSSGVQWHLKNIYGADAERWASAPNLSLQPKAEL